MQNQHRINHQTSYFGNTVLSTVIFSKAMAKMAQANKHNNYDKRNNK